MVTPFCYWDLATAERLLSSTLCKAKSRSHLQMTQNVFPDTVTSIKENVATLASTPSSEGEETKPVNGKVIDMPGHPALYGFS